MARLVLVLIWHACIASLSFAAGSSTSRPKSCPVLYNDGQVQSGCDHAHQLAFVDRDVETGDGTRDFGILEDAFDALTSLQDMFYQPDMGTWPTAIDWTAAVVQTVLSGMMTSLTQSLKSIDGNSSQEKENLMDSLFSQVVGAYFGQDALGIRTEAFDDILWVVLGWLEAINFVRVHSALHYPPSSATGASKRGLRQVLGTQQWHGNYWVESFAHRARIFWELARNGWDTKLCGGGMNWNPRLEPYKNAVTNELWIAASVSMYLYFPGDNNTSPWSSTRDKKYLSAAVDGYNWLMGINMTNSQGLFVDGYHISNVKNGSTVCDKRDEMVYTYNQGVLLTGQRGLFTATGRATYLNDGHKLIESVIAASGWDLNRDTTVDDLSALKPGHLPPWRGLGRGGILEDQCDASGTCSQDGQTFKGIFFHHFVAFCASIDPLPVLASRAIDEAVLNQTKVSHDRACQKYSNWLRHNANAAMATRDQNGVFGMWWGAGIFPAAAVSESNDGVPHDAANVTDYRNYGLPDDGVWAELGQNRLWTPGGGKQAVSAVVPDPAQQVFRYRSRMAPQGTALMNKRQDPPIDPNSRGRNRTVETQQGGLALLRALWEIG